ncbi:hypothetical protein [Nitrospina gracilis]|uniref:hypothetical protein n=1 Tax=Nitrospina gracilis TaxID=35801 RepID=UPI001F323ECF|nr:hypothetical protein [Nitrospina gracilis]MCF8720080.1 hypothetical protein [Nitrospina gracilis Nb-211]
MTEEWTDPPESEGITRGPEEALEREVARSKALKVERLQLRDRVATLQKEVDRLTLENRRLKEIQGRTQGAAQTPPTPATPAAVPRPMVPRSWAWSLLLFNLLALGLLLILLLGR